MEKLLNLVLVLALAVVTIPDASALAAREALDDEELDKVTAAGNPTVVIAEGNGATVNHTDESTFSLALPEGAQRGLRALTVQNVVGEVQLLVNLNVLAVQGNTAGTDQRNFSTQSWGSTAPLLSESVDGHAPVADAARGGDVSVDGNFAPDLTVNPASPACTGGMNASPCTQTNTVNGTQSNSLTGGDAAATSQPGVPGIVEVGIGSADVIVASRCPGDDPSKCSGNTANVTDSPTFSLAMDEGAQVDFGALFVANIVGRAQTAFNINIAAATLNLLPGDGGAPFAQPLGSTSGIIKQVNSGVQFRGSPLGFSPDASINVDVTQTPN